MIDSSDPSDCVTGILAAENIPIPKMTGTTKNKSTKTMLLKAFAAQKPKKVEEKCKGNARASIRASKRSEVPQPSLVPSIDPMESVEAYFMQHGGASSRARGKTSTRTLANLCTNGKSVLLDPLTMEQLMNKDYKPIQSSVCSRLQSDLGSRLFSKWPHYLREGFNLLLYGAGSKRAVINKFREEYLANHNCIVIPGYESSLTIRHVLNAISHDWLQVEDQCKNPTEQLQVITKLLSRPEAAHTPLYLLVHNMDGPGFRNAKAQAIFATLASIPNIHLVASLDHANLPILWSHVQLSRFRWIWEDCTTLVDYSLETSFTNNPLLQHILGGVSQSGGLTGYGGRGTMLASLRQVAASLTQNARDIFRLIAEHQLSAPLEEASDVGMPLEDLYWQCRDAFLTNSEATLRTQLTEFRDHKLLKIKKGIDGTEFLFIPMDRSNLEQFLQNFDSFC